MHNPFIKHHTKHVDISDAITELGWAIQDLSIIVQELREEVDYMIDFLDSDD